MLSLGLLAVGCNATEASQEAPKQQPEKASPPLQLSLIEREAKKLLDQSREKAEADRKMTASVRSAMAAYLFDPGSAQYMSLRAGRGGAICGKFNAKNRYGAYTGYKDFVLSRDRETIFASQFNNGVRSEMYGSFAEAYVNACASKKEARDHSAATAPAPAVEDAPAEEDPFADI